jgi:hypothetical protein
MGPAADEITKIEHELDILRSRYAIFQRWARITKWFFIGVATIISCVGVGYGIVYDSLVAAIVSVVVVVLGGAVYLTRGDRDYRWIDMISPGPGPLGTRTSEAAAIERMITEREARLVEIRTGQT